MFSKLNVVALAILAPVLLLSGVIGLVSPGAQSTSDALAYQIFHLVFGATGLWLVLSRNVSRVRGFNIGFGLIDLYQAVASHLQLFPDRFFRWTSTDDALHIAIGVGLLAIGLFGRPPARVSDAAGK